jgi:hypothetical protein
MTEVVAPTGFRLVLAQSGTPLQAYDQNDWAREMKYENRDPHASLALFRALRRSLLTLLDGLTDAELDRYGMHAERGKETVRALISLYAGHDLNHLGQIERLTRGTRARVRPHLRAGTGQAADRSWTARGARRPRRHHPRGRFPVRRRRIAWPFSASRSPIGRARSSPASAASGRRSTRSSARRRSSRSTCRRRRSADNSRKGCSSDIGFADGLRPAFAQPEWPVPDGVRAG